MLPRAGAGRGCGWMCCGIRITCSRTRHHVTTTRVRLKNIALGRPTTRAKRAPLHSNAPPPPPHLSAAKLPLPPHRPRKKNAVQTYLLLPAKCYAYSRGGGRSVCCAAWHPIRRCAMSARRGASKLREQIRLIVGRDKDPAATGPTAPPFYISVAMTSRSPLNHVLIHVINK